MQAVRVSPPAQVEDRVGTHECRKEGQRPAVDGHWTVSIESPAGKAVSELDRAGCADGDVSGAAAERAAFDVDRSGSFRVMADDERRVTGLRKGGGAAGDVDRSGGRSAHAGQVQVPRRYGGAAPDVEGGIGAGVGERREPHRAERDGCVIAESDLGSATVPAPNVLGGVGGCCQAAARTTNLKCSISTTYSNVQQVADRQVRTTPQIESRAIVDLVISDEVELRVVGGSEREAAGEVEFCAVGIVAPVERAAVDRHRAVDVERTRGVIDADVDRARRFHGDGARAGGEGACVLDVDRALAARGAADRERGLAGLDERGSGAADENITGRDRCVGRDLQVTERQVGIAPNFE